MKAEQRVWTEQGGWSGEAGTLGSDADVVLVFGGRHVLARPELLDELRTVYPDAHLLGCSTAGEIADTNVTDDTVVATAFTLEKSTVRGASASIGGDQDSHEVGRKLASALAGPDLVHVFVISNGLQVNGSELVRGITEVLPPEVVDTNTHRRFLMAAARLDPDIFLDVSFGFVTGTAQTEPEEMVKRFQLVEKQGIPKRWVGASVATGIKSTVYPGAANPTARPMCHGGPRCRRRNRGARNQTAKPAQTIPPRGSPSSASNSSGRS